MAVIVVRRIWDLLPVPFNLTLLTIFVFGRVEYTIMYCCMFTKSAKNSLLTLLSAPPRECTFVLRELPSWVDFAYP